jgi:hypothetical protein
MRPNKEPMPRKRRPTRAPAMPPTAHGAPVARLEAAGAAGGGDEVGDECDRGEYEEDHEDHGPGGAKVREDGVDED